LRHGGRPITANAALWKEEEEEQINEERDEEEVEGASRTCPTGLQSVRAYTSCSPEARA